MKNQTIFIYLYYLFNFNYFLNHQNGDWGLGPIPNPQSPIPNPQSPLPNPQFLKIFFSFLFKNFNK